jgi:hypothetical protein
LPRSADRRGKAIAWTALAVAPVPIVVALIVTAKPVYPPDACFYGASRAALDLTDRYLDLMVPLGMFALAATAGVVCWFRLKRWRPVAAAMLAWAASTLVWRQAADPIVYPGGTVALFGIFLTPPALAVMAAAAVQTSWLRAIAWFQTLYLLPVLLGLAKILAQPACYPAEFK